MIKYTPLFELMKKRGITTYTLIYKYKFSSSFVNRLKHNLPITTTSIDDLCNLLDCEPSDILEYIREEKSSKSIIIE